MINSRNNNDLCVKLITLIAILISVPCYHATRSSRLHTFAPSSAAACWSCACLAISATSAGCSTGLDNHSAPFASLPEKGFVQHRSVWPSPAWWPLRKLFNSNMRSQSCCPGLHLGTPSQKLRKATSCRHFLQMAVKSDFLNVSPMQLLFSANLIFNVIFPSLLPSLGSKAGF